MDRVGENIPTTWTLRGRTLGECWQVETNMMNDDWFLEKGWPEFVQENSLEEGDFLTFCFVGNSTFLVTIFSTNGCRVEDDHDTSSSDDETSESEDSEVNESKRIVSRPRSSPMGNTRRNPCFEVKMVKSYFKKGNLVVPMDFWNRYMRKSEEEDEDSRRVTLRVKRESWTVHLMLYYQYGRVLLQRGFPKFLKDNALKVGTSCTFQLIDVNPFSFKVTITR
ncbi:hypothetical protein C2S52_004759 [Perilla frutescens var. hirtella]|nr:hypothetical protein C2S51_010851 [Perilla frutescens var. frutescens]KAH6794282.1 hypothetical protein C2S52_004759 [Perilla frutescens var. hirtella]